MHQFGDEEWDRIVGVNLTGTFLTAPHVLAQMLTQDPLDDERGTIVTIASIEGLEGTAGGWAYNASKGGVVLLTRNMAVDYGRQGIRSNSICPGFIDTPMTQSVFDLDGMAEVKASLVEPTCCGASAIRPRSPPSRRSSSSDDASFVTGAAIAVDGGYTAGRDHGVTALMGLR